MTKRPPGWRMGMIPTRDVANATRDFANATRGGVWATTSAGARFGARRAPVRRSAVRSAASTRAAERGEHPCGGARRAPVRRSAASTASTRAAERGENPCGGARRAPVRRRGSTRPATMQGGHSAFDLPGGLGYAPPALDGTAVERASAPVAASVMRET
jgi:hypothetical protein